MVNYGRVQFVGIGLGYASMVLTHKRLYIWKYFFCMTHDVDVSLWLLDHNL